MAAETMDPSADIVGLLTAREQAIEIAVARQAEYLRMIQESPENAVCVCGNNERFVGHDDHGFGGPDECECGHFDDDPKVQVAAPEACTCETVLSQPYRIERADDTSVIEFHYEAFSGGGFAAEIASYTRIDCADCGRQVYPVPAGCLLSEKPEEVPNG